MSSKEIVTPLLAVDGIVFTSPSQILLVQRKNEPKGYALPGGFVDVGESPSDAVEREIEEELSLKISEPKLFGVYGDPDRDPRGHTVSIVYFCNAYGQEPEAGDDAKSYLKINLVSNSEDQLSILNEIDLAFDHKRIIMDFHNAYYSEN